MHALFAAANSGILLDTSPDIVSKTYGAAVPMEE